MVNVHAAGRQSMGATPGRARAARFYASPSFSPEPESPPSQHEASLPVIQETLVMRDEDEDDEDELDELDVLQSQSADRPHEADEEPQAGGDDDDVDEPADDDAAGATPKGPKLAIRSGHTELSASPSPSSASADDEDDDDPADPALFSPSLTEPSVEAMLDRRAEEQAAALADAAAAALAAAPAPQANAVASSSRAPAADAGAAPPAASAPRPAPRRDFFRGKTFFIAGRRPVKPGPLAEVADIRHAILDAGGSLVKLSDGPSYVVEVGDLTAAMEQRIDAMAATELLDVPAFRKLFATGLRRLAKAAQARAAEPTEADQGEGAEPVERSEEPTVERASADVEMVDAAADERPATAEAADSPAPTVDAPAADDVPAQLQFRDKQGMVLIFQLQSDLPAGVQEDLKRLIEEHGGRVSSDLAEVDIRLVDPTTAEGQAIVELESAPKRPHWRSRPWHWVAASVAQGRLVKTKAMDCAVPVFVKRGSGQQLSVWVLPELDDREALEKTIRSNGGILGTGLDADVVVVAVDLSDPAMAERVRKLREGRPDIRIAPSLWVPDQVASGQRARLPKESNDLAPQPQPQPEPAPAPAPARPKPAARAPPAPVDRAEPAVKTEGKRPARKDFTPDDDRWMIRYMAAALHDQKLNPFKGQGLGTTGNRIFQDMCDEDELSGRPWAADHTWQSWRNRYKTKRKLGFERALDKRLQKLDDGVECPLLAQIRAKRRAKTPRPPAKRQRRSAAKGPSAPEREAEETDELESEQSEEIEDADDAPDAGGPSATLRSAPPPRTRSSGGRTAAARAPEAAAASSARLPSAVRSVAPSEAPSSQDADAAEPELDRRSPAPSLLYDADDDDRTGGMDYEPELPEQAPVPQAPVNDAPVRIPSEPALSNPDAAEGAPLATAERAPAPFDVVAASDDDSDMDDEDDESGQATQYMKQTLAALAGGASADVNEDETDDDDDVATPQPEPPRQPSPTHERAVEDVELTSGDDDSDGSDDGGPGGATLAMQALLDHAAQPVNSDDSSDDEAAARLASQPTATAATPRAKMRSTSPLPPARSSHENTPVKRTPAPAAAVVETAADDDAAVTGERESATPSTTATSTRLTPLGREKRRLSRPAPRKSLDLPGIGANVPHFDLGGSVVKKPRLSARSAGESTSTPALPTLTPKERAVQWATAMEAKYAVDRRQCAPFLRAVWPDAGAAERILFASLPLADGHVWAADEDGALLEMEGPLIEQLEATLGVPACYRRLHLLKKHKRGPPAQP